MRLDKFLKISRLIKRRTVANKVSSAGKIYLNSKIAKPSSDIKIGDVIEINMGNIPIRVKVLKISEIANKENASEMYEVI